MKVTKQVYGIGNKIKVGGRFTTLAALAMSSGLCLAVPDEKAAEDKAPSAEAEKSAPQGKPGRKYGKATYHRAFMARIKKEPIHILFLGDSITEGLNQAGAETMLAKYEAHKPAVFGVGGEDTNNLLYRLTTGELDIEPNPKVVVLMIGVNNISHNKGITPDKVAEGIKQNIDVIRAKVPNSKLVLMSLLPFGKEIDSPVRQKVIGVNKIIQGYADGKSIIYVDAYSRFLDSKGTVMDGLMDAASLHPLDKGYQVWHDALWPVVEPLLK